MGCSLHHLRRLSAKHRWKTRAAAFDNRRAESANIGIEQLLHKDVSDWHQRAEAFRLYEWRLYEKMLHAADAALGKINEHPGRVTLHGIVKLYELASMMGRRAAGMPLEPEPEKPQPAFPPRNMEADLERAYGSKGP